MADIAKGTDFDWGGTTITEVVSFTGPSIVADAIDVTDLADSAKPYLHPGVYDPGEVTLEINFDEDDASHGVLVADMLSGTTRVLTIEWQNATQPTGTWSSNAFMTAFSPAGAVGDKLTASATFKLAGTLTPA